MCVCVCVCVCDCGSVSFACLDNTLNNLSCSFSKINSSLDISVCSFSDRFPVLFFPTSFNFKITIKLSCNTISVHSISNRFYFLCPFVFIPSLFAAFLMDSKFLCPLLFIQESWSKLIAIYHFCLQHFKSILLSLFASFHFRIMIKLNCNIITVCSFLIDSGFFVRFFSSQNHEQT